MPLLSKADAALLSALQIDPQPLNGKSGFSYTEDTPSSGSGFIDAWRNWERCFRLNLARLRFSRVKREGAAPVEAPGFPIDAAALAAKAMQESPLDAENLIDRARWDAIEGMQGINYFHRNVIFAYLLKLMILERQASFQAETGFSEYQSLYASILEQSGTFTAGDFK
ncbi:MAG: DUF2764 domain-containing protein [Treponema sp.]|nr:DUF2764 domain-containing protein [Treponema sp.]